MSTVFYTHAACLEHDMGAGHPEQPARLRAILGALDAEEFAGLERREAPEATEEQICRVHPKSYFERVRNAAPTQGLVRLDPDTAMNPGSLQAALRAAGAVCAAVDDVMNGGFRNAFCAVRPPGHHAEPSQAMGFCIFNNVAIGARHARARWGIDRVAVVDFDVHHGNGTQASFWNDPGLMYVSSHQAPLYPGTGRASERGVGNILNIPLPPFAGSQAVREGMTRFILPALRAFRPELLMISAGFDGHAHDPLAQLEFTTEDFGWMTEQLAMVAEEFCEGRLVSALEGGYELAALAESAAAHVRTLMVA